MYKRNGGKGSTKRRKGLERMKIEGIKNIKG